MGPLTKKRALAWIGATILAPLVIGWMASGFYIGMWYSKTRHQGPPPADVLVQGMTLGVVVGLWFTVGALWLTQRKHSTCAGLFSTATRHPWMDFLIGLGLGAMWVAAYDLFNVVALREMLVLDGAKLLSVPATFSAGFCEEFLFRGFLFLVIARAGGSAKSQIIWTSVAFGLAHVFWGPWGMLWTTLLGGTFAIVRLWCGNVWPAVLAHTLLNLCIEPALLEKAMSGGFR